MPKKGNFKNLQAPIFWGGKFWKMGNVFKFSLNLKDDEKIFLADRWQKEVIYH
ncbi:hypothetical protein CM15mP5_2520 [bacterium]|nr:MAG: hypothetical protein CM15mP5_2520 [bacterium]